MIRSKLGDRQKLADDGIVVLVAAVDRHTGKLVRTPEAMSHGFAGAEEAEELMRGVEQLVAEVLGGTDASVNWAELHESLKDDVSDYLHRQTHRHPLVIPVMLEV